MCRLLFLQFLTWMEGLAKFQASRKAYRSHLTRIYHKIQELDLTQRLEYGQKSDDKKEIIISKKDVLCEY